MNARSHCPHCGNRDPELVQDNGEPGNHPDLTLMCMARVQLADSSFSDPRDHEPEDYDAAGLVACGMQWCPNE